MKGSTKAIAYGDGGVRGNPGPYACAIVLYRGDESDYSPLERSLYLGSNGTNNQAEYGALILALEVAAEIGVSDLTIRLDSKLIVEQVLGNWRIKNQELQVLKNKCVLLSQSFNTVLIDHVRREKNTRADRIVTDLLDGITGVKRRM